MSFFQFSRNGTINRFKSFTLCLWYFWMAGPKEDLVGVESDYNTGKSGILYFFGASEPRLELYDDNGKKQELKSDWTSLNSACLKTWCYICVSFESISGIFNTEGLKSQYTESLHSYVVTQF